MILRLSALVPSPRLNAALLGCAVADELEGSELAVDSLRPWMIYATRFPAAWIAAVEATLAQARAQARRTATSNAKQP
jgi:hypothetical protein